MFKLFRFVRAHLILYPSALSILLLLAAGCSTVERFSPTLTPTELVESTTEPTTEINRGTPQPIIISTLVNDRLKSRSAFGYTYHRPDGNRLVSGVGSIQDEVPLDIPLGGKPIWLVAAPAESGSIWAAVLEDGRVEAYLVSGEDVAKVRITPDHLPPGMPPLLVVAGNHPRLVVGPSDSASLTHPVMLANQPQTMAYIAKNGDLVIRTNEEIARLPVNGLPDARLLVDERDRLLLLTDPTTRYDHGVLGDAVEAGSITLIETLPELKVLQKIIIEPPAVIEAIAPIWTDFNGDSRREIIVTRSDINQGAQIVVFLEDGTELAAGPTIGRGYRWRNQLAVAPTAPDGELELVDVLTPHIGGVVEFFQLIDGGLEITSQLAGFTSHVIGTRNLDMGLAGDFDGDGIVEVLLPTQERTQLGAVRHTAGGALLVWFLPANGTISTNLAAVTHSDGSISLGIGTEEAKLRIWGP